MTEKYRRIFAQQLRTHSVLTSSSLQAGLKSNLLALSKLGVKTTQKIKSDYYARNEPHIGFKRLYYMIRDSSTGNFELNSKFSDELHNLDSLAFSGKYHSSMPEFTRGN